MPRAPTALALFGLSVLHGCSCSGPLPDLDAGGVGVGDAGGDDVAGDGDGGERDAGNGAVDAGGGADGGHLDDGGPGLDAGLGVDGGAGDDAGSSVDGGTHADGGPGTDGGAGDDAGAADAGAASMWTCDPAYLGDGDCDCGCGIVDSDCADASLASCQYTSCPAHLTIDPDDNSQCVDAVCGNGFRELDEHCDDGVTGDCASTHDDGTGVCLGGTSCASDYVWTGDACVPTVGSGDVTIYVNNFCQMTVVPQSITVPAGQSVYIDWHNASADYPVDIWLSYGGGYLDLPTGATWDEPILHCGGINPHTEYADISTACSEFRFVFHCE